MRIIVYLVSELLRWLRERYSILARRYFLGFDRNDYPGAANMSALRSTFAYSSYWLNNASRAGLSTWLGHRAELQGLGFGFLVLYMGRTSSKLPSDADAAVRGRTDGTEAVDNATRENFPMGTIIFLDQEEGGVMTSPQRSYLHAWFDTVNASSFRAGVYCSGIPTDDGAVTAVDIRNNAAGRKVVFWVYNDSCGPSPGCVFPDNPPPPSASGIPFAQVWQFAQSPQRFSDFAKDCPRTGEYCYPPGFGPSPLEQIFVDLNTAGNSDPSRARRLVG